MRKKHEPVMTGTKVCSGKDSCGKTKPITEFGVDRRKHDGRKIKCYECVNKAQRAPGARALGYVQVRESDGFMNCTHPDHEGDVWLPPERFHLDSSKKRGRRTHCKDCVRRKAGYLTERIPVEISSDGTAKVCTKCQKMKKLEKFPKCEKGVLERGSRCQKCWNEWRKQYMREKYATDLAYQLQCKVRSAVRRCLEAGGWTKTSRAYEYLQCSYEEFMAHVNSGDYEFGDPNVELELDHIVPVALAESEADVMTLNHWSNWRLVPKDVNRDKNDAFPARSLLTQQMTPALLAIYEQAEHETGPGTWTV